MTLADLYEGMDPVELNARQPALQKLLGISLRPDLSGDGVVVGDGEIRPEVLGPAGTYQGGALATLIDTIGAVCATWHAGRKLVATQDLTISYLAPGRAGPIRATATLLRAGSKAVVVEVRCTDVGAGDRLIAVALVTCVVIGDLPPDLQP